MSDLLLKNVCYTYDSGFQLRGINIVANRGDLICLLGSSGCGKTTILKLLAGLQRLRDGTIVLYDVMLSSSRGEFVPTLKRNIGIVFQHPALFPHKTVFENVLFTVKRRSLVDSSAFANKMLNLVGMINYKNSYPHMLSGGQQQLVTIARAMAAEPSLMLMDEPFSNMDVLLRRSIRSKVVHMLKDMGIITMFVTHDPLEALEVADRIYILGDGEVLQSGTPYEVYNEPVNCDMAQLFGDLNKIEATVKGHNIRSILGDMKIPECYNFLKEGQIVTLCVRPEFLVISDDGCIEAEIAKLMPFGNTILVKIGNELLKITGRTDVNLSVGNFVKISWNSRRSFLFF